MRFNKQDMEMWINEYGSLKEDGLSLKDIQKHFKQKYGLKDISSIRKNHDILKRSFGIEINQNQKDIEAIAQAKADLLVNRKINVQMNKTLHQQANDNARWELIKEKLENWHSTEYEFDRTFISYPPKDSDKDVIYVVGDIHYRGKQDSDLVLNTFAKIDEEIIQKKYNNVTLILTGDNIDGEIHNEQQRTNEPVLQATMEFTDLLIQCINSIPQINEVYIVYGNHEEVRLWGDKGTDNNVGKFIYWGLKRCLKYADVYTELDKDGKPIGGEVMFYYKNKSVVLLHGHQGYAKSKAKLIEHCAVKYQIQPDYIILGHFHTSKTNQFSKNHWLITAPALKNWESNWDKANGYCGLGQYIKLKLNWKSPQITTINIQGE